MKPSETVKLVAIVRALCPSQKFDEYTPDAWALVLDDIALNEAQSAVRTIYRNQGDDTEWVRKIEADDIIRQVRRDRNQKLEANFDQLIPPIYTTPRDYQNWLTQAKQRLAAGETPEQINADYDRGELKPFPHQLKLVGRRIEDDANTEAG